MTCGILFLDFVQLREEVLVQIAKIVRRSRIRASWSRWRSSRSGYCACTRGYYENAHQPKFKTVASHQHGRGSRDGSGTFISGTSSQSIPSNSSGRSLKSSSLDRLVMVVRDWVRPVIECCTNGILDYFASSSQCSTSASILSSKSLVFSTGFHPSDRDRSPRAREFVPRNFTCKSTVSGSYIYGHRTRLGMFFYLVLGKRYRFI